MHFSVFRNGYFRNSRSFLWITNTTAVACLSHFDTSHSAACYDLTFTIWEWCIAREIRLAAAHIPGKENTAADAEPRKVNVDGQWQLNTLMLQQALLQLQVQPSVDLSASRINRQMSRYVFYRPDPLAIAVDAFSMSWKETEFYAFPPLSVIPAGTRKNLAGKEQWGAGGSTVAFAGMVASPQTADRPPVVLRAGRDKPLLMLPSRPGEVHPLQRQHLKLLVCRVSGFDRSGRDCLRRLPLSLFIDSWRPASKDAYNCHIRK